MLREDGHQEVWNTWCEIYLLCHSAPQSSALSGIEMGWCIADISFYNKCRHYGLCLSLQEMYINKYFSFAFKKVTILQWGMQQQQ